MSDETAKVKMIPLDELEIKIQAKREALELANQKLRAIFDSTTSGLLVTDEDLIITEVNPAFCTMLECESGAILGMPLSQVMKAAGRDQ